MSNSIYTTRNIPLSSGYISENIKELITWLEQMPAIKKADYIASKNRIIVEYDLLKLSYKQLLSIVTDKGIHIRNGFSFSLLSSWLNYIDKTAKSNALAPPPSCCNRPPGSRR